MKSTKIKNKATDFINKIVPNSANSEEDDVKHLSQMLMYRFLSQIEELMEDRELTKKDLAKKINTSASFLTQVYRGNKPLNFITLAKIEAALNVRFSVTCVEESLIELDHNIERTWDETQINYFINRFNCTNGFWMYKNRSAYSIDLNTAEKLANSDEFENYISTHRQKRNTQIA